MKTQDLGVACHPEPAESRVRRDGARRRIPRLPARIGGSFAILGPGACFVAALLIALLAACSSDSLDRQRWDGMSEDARLLYVKSLLGEQKVKEAKGGNDRVYPLPAEDYLKKIEAAYAGGDSRTPREIFAEMSSPR